MSKLRLPEYRGSLGGTCASRAGGGGSPGSASEAPAPGFAGFRSSAGGIQTGAAVCGGSGVAGSGGGTGHIHVAVRVRPLPSGEDGIIEVAGSGAIAIRKDAATGGNQFLSTQQGRIEERTFDQVFGPEATQSEVYGLSCEPLISEAVARGKSATVFVYGATGAGKTHTMFGGQASDQRGLIFRAVPEVFRRLEAVETEVAGSFEVRVSFLEIYNEVVRDLLQPSPNDGSASATAASTCRVLEDAQRGVVKVANLVEAQVRCDDEALRYLQAGMQARTVEATAANSQSSRAHAVFTLTIEHVREQARGIGPFARRSTQVRSLYSKICLIDLAGSERAAITQNSGSALKDGARINQSLLALANCIDALTHRCRDGGAGTPRKKPPYRDSKLTLMLKGSLTGDGLVAMIANVHPGRTHFEDSNNTLEYAKRASTVRVTRRVSRAQGSTGSGAALGAVAGGGGFAAFGGAGTCVNGEEAPLMSPGALDGGGGIGGARVGSRAASSPGPGLPCPPSTVTRRRRERLDQARGRARPVCSAEQPTTASNSPEECLSEISLSLGGPEESEETSPEEGSDVGQCPSSLDGRWCCGGGGEEGEDAHSGGSGGGGSGGGSPTAASAATAAAAAVAATETSAAVAAQDHQEAAGVDEASRRGSWAWPSSVSAVATAAGATAPAAPSSPEVAAQAQALDGAFASFGASHLQSSPVRMSAGRAVGGSPAATAAAATAAAAVASATAAVARCLLTRDATRSDSAAALSVSAEGSGGGEAPFADSMGGEAVAACLGAGADEAECQLRDPLAARIVATVCEEKAQLHARLSAVVIERDALLQDRRELEEENERLRAASLEKDQQLALLLERLERCGVTDASPA